MVPDTWIMRVGSSVSANLKQVLLLEPSKKKAQKKLEQKESIGILSFELASVMSRTINLYKSLSDSEFANLKYEIAKSEGLIHLISSSKPYLLDLVLAEKLDELDRIAGVVSRLGKKCSLPALSGFVHVYRDIVNGAVGSSGLDTFMLKDFDSVVKKMERYVHLTCNLHSELQILKEMESAKNRLQLQQNIFDQKLILQNQEINQLKSTSLWGESYDKVVDLMARAVCTIYGTICASFEQHSFLVDYTRRQDNATSSSSSSSSSRCLPQHIYSKQGERRTTITQRKWRNLQNMKCCPSSQHFDGVTVSDCLSMGASFSMEFGTAALSEEDGDAGSSSSSTRMAMSAQLYGRQYRRRAMCASTNGTIFGHGSRLAEYASPATAGGSAVAIHFANIIIVIEKLVQHPHLVGEDARDGLYRMLTERMRVYLRRSMKGHMNEMIELDADVAEKWKETVNRTLGWIAPMAHNMIRWQTERNLERKWIVARHNVLLIHTLYFADRVKTEDAICELLFGLNYICRFEIEQNSLVESSCSFRFSQCLDWAAV